MEKNISLANNRTNKLGSQRGKNVIHGFPIHQN